MVWLSQLVVMGRNVEVGEEVQASGFECSHSSSPQDVML